MIPRFQEREVLRIARSFPALVLTGPRQAGKTTLLRHCFPNHHYVTLDLPSHADLAENNPDRFFELHPTPVIVDEVQYAPGLFRHVKQRIDQRRSEKGQFILTGSQKFNLMKQVSDSLAGRCGLLELEPLSHAEIAQSAQNLTSHSHLLRFLARGGMPELWVEQNIRARDFYTGYFATYLERDVRQILAVANLRDFERFMRACAVRSGQVLNKSDLARDVGITVKTIDAWLSILSASNQVLLIEPWFGNLSKRLSKSPKLYLGDTGLLCFLLGLDEETISLSNMLGAIWETFVFSEIRRNLCRKRGVPTVWYYRDKEQTEVDFVVETGVDVTLIEAKFAEHPTERDSKSLRSVADLFKKTEQTRMKTIQKILAARPSGRESILQDGTRVLHGLDIGAMLADHESSTHSRPD